MDSFDDLIKGVRKYLLSIPQLGTTLFKKTTSMFGSSKTIKRRGSYVYKNYNSEDLPTYPSKTRIPSATQLKYIGKYLSPKELTIIKTCIAIILISATFAGTRFVVTHLQVVPVRGGVYTEAVIGSPKHINPLYSSISDIDSDITKLVFSSLYSYGKNGELEKDLVESYDLSEDFKTYTFTIRQGVKWHDATDFSVDDIVFTFQALKDAQYESPLRLSFSGVEIEKVDENKIRFILSEPYAPFLNLLTFGILPSHLWYQVSPASASIASFNLEPIGSGPFVADKLAKDKLGNIKEYKLIANEDYYGEVPKVDLTFKLYNDSIMAIDALNNGLVDGLSYLSREDKSNIIIPKKLNYYSLYLPQLTTIFLNEKTNKALGDKSLRQALAYSIDRNSLISDIFKGDAYLVDGPILPNSFAYNNEILKYEHNVEKAKTLLDDIDWKEVEITEEDITKAEEDLAGDDENLQTMAQVILDQGKGIWRKKDNKYLLVELTTVERSESEAVVNAVKIFWEAIGVKTTVNILPPSRMQSEVIKPRSFEALFYGQVVGADPDPYAFWHSSQSGENGFNIAGFANKKVDQLLEDARITSDIAERQEKYNKFQEIITEESPSIFMYSPMYTYIQNKKIKGFDVSNILVPADRFSNIDEWYIKTGKKLIW